MGGSSTPSTMRPSTPGTERSTLQIRHTVTCKISGRHPGCPSRYGGLTRRRGRWRLRQTGSTCRMVSASRVLDCRQALSDDELTNILSHRYCLLAQRRSPLHRRHRDAASVLWDQLFFSLNCVGSLSLQLLDSALALMVIDPRTATATMSTKMAPWTTARPLRS